jgi:hypothetical protein
MSYTLSVSRVYWRKDMRGWKDGYCTKAHLATEIKRIVAKTHGLSRDEILVNFVTKWRLVKYPTGLVAKVATIVLRAPGFETRRYTVDQAKGQRWSMR